MARIWVINEIQNKKKVEEETKMASIERKGKTFVDESSFFLDTIQEWGLWGVDCIRNMENRDWLFVIMIILIFALIRKSLISNKDKQNIQNEQENSQKDVYDENYGDFIN